MIDIVDLLTSDIVDLLTSDIFHDRFQVCAIVTLGGQEVTAEHLVHVGCLEINVRECVLTVQGTPMKHVMLRLAHVLYVM